MLDKRYTKPYIKRIEGGYYTMRRLDLSRLQSRFENLVRAYLKSKELTQGELADIVGIQRTHLNLLLSGKRPLSAYYVFQFLRRGIFSMSEIQDGDAETEREKMFWKSATEAENVALLAKIADLRKKGIDIEALLDAVNPDTIKK